MSRPVRARMRAAEDMFRGALDALPSHIVILDEEGTILFANQAWRRFGSENGFDSADAGVGRSYFAGWDPATEPLSADARTAHMRILDLVAGRTDGIALEYPCHSPTHKRWFVLRGSRFHLDGRVRVVIEHHDITSRKLSEEMLRESHVALEAFTASAAHDLRAPLRRIAAVAQEIETETDPGEAARLTSMLAREATRAHALVSDLLAFSRTSAQPVTRADVDLSLLARRILDELEAEAPQRNVQVEIQPRVHARADPSLVRIALHNLLSNAWKFTAGRSDARITFERELPRTGGEPVYVVRDNGVGFDAGLADKLFHPFRRLPSAAGFEGSGIGLATVRRIVERHEGRIWAEGDAGAGATFRFTLGEEDR